MADKLIFEYYIGQDKHEMVIGSCGNHHIYKCRINGRTCNYPSGGIPEHCRVIGDKVLNGVIKKG